MPLSTALAFALGTVVGALARHYTARPRQPLAQVHPIGAAWNRHPGTFGGGGVTIQVASGPRGEEAGA